MRISPEAVDAASHHAPAIFGAGPRSACTSALSRVQAMLGHRGVVTPAIGGGRWLAERQVLVPWGDRAGAREERARPWPGSLPEPLPTTVFAEPIPVEVTAARAAVDVDERGRVPWCRRCSPRAGDGVRSRHGRGRGPWSSGGGMPRARVARTGSRSSTPSAAWLLVCEGDAWMAEASYD